MSLICPSHMAFVAIFIPIPLVIVGIEVISAIFIPVRMEPTITTSAASSAVSFAYTSKSVSSDTDTTDTNEVARFIEVMLREWPPLWLPRTLIEP